MLFQHGPKSFSFVGVAFQERPNVAHLIQNEPVFRILLQQPEGLQDIRQSDAEIFLAGLENRALPVSVRDHDHLIAVGSERGE